MRNRVSIILFGYESYVSFVNISGDNGCVKDIKYSRTNTILRKC